MVLEYENLNDADKAIIEELREGRNIPSNIASNLDYTREYVSSRLKRLREHDIVRNIGGGVHELIEENVPQENIATADSSGIQGRQRREPEANVEEPDGDDDPVRTAVGDVEFPSTKDREECIEAIRATYEYLQNHGEATMSEFVTEVMPEHPVGYDADADVEKINDPDQRNRSTWWRRVVKPGLEALPDVESPPKGASNWTYTGASDE